MEQEFYFILLIKHEKQLMEFCQYKNSNVFTLASNNYFCMTNPYTTQFCFCETKITLFVNKIKQIVARHFI